MSECKYVTIRRTLKYHISMQVFPPVPIHLYGIIRQVIRLVKAGRDDATVQWYSRPTTVSQVVKECALFEFIERGVWVDDLGTSRLDGSVHSDFVLPKENGCIYEYSARETR